jgi:superfamily II DNA/RNA helicase
MVATDVAARGLDISSIGLVVQADAPRDSDTDTHRVGRMGQAGASGDAITMLDGRSMELRAPIWLS